MTTLLKFGNKTANIMEKCSLYTMLTATDQKPQKNEVERGPVPFTWSGWSNRWQYLNGSVLHRESKKDATL